jgi:cation transport ATPase
MKCGGCVRAVEQRLAQQPGVRHVSVNLLTRTAWLELANASVDLNPLLASLESLGFSAHSRDQDAPLVSRRELQKQQHWWRELVKADAAGGGMARLGDGLRLQRESRRAAGGRAHAVLSQRTD